MNVHICCIYNIKRLCNFNFKDIYFEPDLTYQIKLNGKLLKCQTNWQNFCLSTTYQCIRSYNKTNNIRYFLLCEHRHKKTYESKNLKLKWHSFFMLNKWYLEKVSSKRARSGDNFRPEPFPLYQHPAKFNGHKSCKSENINSHVIIGSWDFNGGSCDFLQEKL